MLRLFKSPFFQLCTKCCSSINSSQRKFDVTKSDHWFYRGILPYTTSHIFTYPSHQTKFYVRKLRKRPHRASFFYNFIRSSTFLTSLFLHPNLYQLPKPWHSSLLFTEQWTPTRSPNSLASGGEWETDGCEALTTTAAKIFESPRVVLKKAVGVFQKGKLNQTSRRVRVQ